MASSDERREVAERLRNEGRALTAIDMGVELASLTLDDAIGIEHNATWEECFDRLADLIEPQERTCRILQAYGDESEELDHRMEEIAGTPEDTVACICQSCGHEFRYDRMVRPRFCPHCGCRVVSHDDN